MAAEWVTLKEASERAGVAVSTLRSWYRAGKVESKEQTSRYGPTKMVRMDQVEALAEEVPAREPSDSTPTVAVPAASLASALDSLAQTVREQSQVIAVQGRVIETLTGSRTVLSDNRHT